MTGILRPGAVLLGVFALVTGLAYPLAVTGVARAVFPGRANGSLLERGGRIVGSALVGQRFHDPRYFWGRPSATSPAPYDPRASGGSNLGPANPALAVAVRERVASLRAAHPEHASQPVPVDMVTASGSGLDPHISPAAALFQIGRVARARAIDEGRVRSLVETHVEGRTLGLFGEPRVNVLRLNLDLDELDRAITGTTRGEDSDR